MDISLDYKLKWNLLSFTIDKIPSRDFTKLTASFNKLPHNLTLLIINVTKKKRRKSKAIPL